MLHTEKMDVQERLRKGNIGLEKENLRVDENGYFAQTKHPFPEDSNIVRDFCENQVEVNTDVCSGAKEAVEELHRHTRRIQQVLAQMERQEYLWPFSNPPYIRNEADIPIAQFIGIETSKTKYREYLSNRYGRYKMTLSGIHFNYSFDDELLHRDFRYSGEPDFQEYKNQLYLTLAERVVAYGWLITALTAASPLMDGSYVEKKQYDVDTFHGMASVRCSEIGYWNFFAPTLNYSSVGEYADSIQHYVDKGWIRFPSELYYPVRLKPAGENTLDNLREHGVNHIELRMFDLNPLVPEGIDVRDVEFAQLFLIWLASTPRQPFTEKDQIQAVQNFKNAAHYDLKTVKIVVPNGEVYSVAEAGLKALGFMREFYKEFPADVHEILDFEEEKLLVPEQRYAWRIRKAYAGGFVKKGLALAKEQQRLALTQMA